MLRVGLLALAPAVLTANGCSDDTCRSGESRCDGDAILGCGTGADGFDGEERFTALGSGCGSDRCLDVVVEGKRRAVCSSSGAVDERCPADVFGTICVGGKTLLACDKGYSSRERECGACIVAELTKDAICALEATKSPLCQDGTRKTCDGATVVECEQGYVVAREPCIDASATCVESDDPAKSGRAHCATAEACVDRDVTRCEGDVVRGCFGGHVVSEPCGSGEGCRDYFEAARCEARCQKVRSSVCIDP